MIKSCEECKMNEEKNNEKIKELEETIEKLQNSEAKSQQEIENLRK